MSTLRPGSGTARAWMKLLMKSELGEQVAADLEEARLPPATWYDVLVQLRDAGPEGISQQDLTETLILPKATVVKLMDRFEDRGYVYRQPSADDARVTIVVLKPEGQDVLKRMWSVYGQRIEKIMGKAMGQREQRRLLQVVERIERTLHQR
jgi:DNA-binding MarR family transcriptional regulator